MRSMIPTGESIRGTWTIGHAAIDAGANIVIGHGPYHSLPVEVYCGKVICYGLGSFSVHTTPWTGRRFRRHE